MLRSSHLAFWTNFILQVFLLHGDGLDNYSEPTRLLELLQDTSATSGHPVEVRKSQKKINAARGAIAKLEEEEQPDRTVGQTEVADSNVLLSDQAQEEALVKPCRSVKSSRRTAGPRAGRSGRPKAAPGSSDTLQPPEPKKNASQAKAVGAVRDESKGQQAASGRLASDTPHTNAASKESMFDDCLRQGLCRRPLLTSPRTSFLAATLALVVLVSFKIGISLGTTSMRIYQGAMDGLDKIPTRTSRWRQTPEEILAEVYAQMDPRLRGRNDKS